MPDEVVTSSDSFTPEHEPLRVFISYRTNTDALLASALQRLIESSIDPQPKVFVAGNGGIRPSNAGFRQQITDAARKAHAFVAIITNSSKEREWIFFEAGAAWGQNLVYVPLLIGTQPRDLPNTIADYQALNGQAKDDMHRLVQDLAPLAGCQVKERFGSRFQQFNKVVEDYLKGSLDSDAKESVGGQSITDAMDLMAKGDRERATQLFDRLEAEANVAENQERLCMIKIYRIQATRKNAEWQAGYEELDGILKNTSAYHYFMASCVQHPLQEGVTLSGCSSHGG